MNSGAEQRIYAKAVAEKFLICFSPATAVFVDDKQIVVDHIKMRFEDKLCKIFTVPEDALECIKQFEYPNLAEQFVRLSSGRNGDDDISVSLWELHHLIYSRARFGLVAVLCADHNMPGMTGIELCEQLQPLPLLKILFTGMATLQQCQEAERKGIIQSYINKDIEAPMAVLDLIRNRFEQRFFAALGREVVTALVKQKGTHSYLFTDAFMTFITAMHKETQATERYILDASGSYLFLTADGKASALIVRSKEDIAAALAANEQAKAEDKAPEDVIKKIKSGTHVLYTGAGNDVSVPPREWGNYLFEFMPFTEEWRDHFEMMPDVDNIRYAYIANNVPGIDRDRIVSYEAYLADQKI